MLKQSLFLLALLGNLAAVPAIAQPAGEPTPMAQAAAAIKLQPKWQRIEVDEEKPTSYRLRLYYKPTALLSEAEIAADTKVIARAALAELVREGKDPSKDSIYLSVWARQEVKGATGESLGRAIYDYNSDQLEYRPDQR